MNFIVVKLGLDGALDFTTAQVAATLDEAKIVARNIGLGRINLYRLVAEVTAVCDLRFTEVAK